MPRLSGGMSAWFRFRRRLEFAADFLGLAIISLYLISMLPSEFFSGIPATGGDTGSHYWTLHSLVKEGLPTGHLRVWNPGNKAGEPLLLGYFPLPFLFMAFLAWFMELGNAFNLGTLLPLLLLPFAVYFWARGIGQKFPNPLLAAVASLFLIYNEEFVAWGGNLKSTLAGQFSYEYALVFFLLAGGAFAWELRRAKPVFLSAVLYSCVLGSHVLVAVFIPLAFLGNILAAPRADWKRNARAALLSGGLAFAFSAWVVWPLIDNLPWTSSIRRIEPAYSLILIWFRESLKQAFPPRILWLLGLGGLFVLAILGLRRRVGTRAARQRTQVLCCLPLVFGSAVGGIFLERNGVGLARAFPLLLLYSLLSLGLLAGCALQSVGTRWFRPAIVFSLSTLAVVWIHSSVKFAPQWLAWNYSGMDSKPLNEELRKLAAFLNGSFSQPRVLTEHNAAYVAAGTPRVFELLPWLSGRGVLEGVYAESTRLSAQLFHLQALVSRQGSCVFVPECPRFDLVRAIPKMWLFGASQLLVSTPELIQAAKERPEFKEIYRAWPWTLFELRVPVKLIEVFSRLPDRITEGEMRAGAFWRYSVFDGTREPAVGGDVPTSPSAWTGGRCDPEVQLEFNRIRIYTPCPGRAHWLKVAFHPAWKSLSGEKLFQVSPGFIGLVPVQGDTVLEFGHRLGWRLAEGFSILAFLGYSLFLIRRSRRLA